MNWEKCKEYGLTEINHSNNNIKLYYNRFSFVLAGNPPWIKIESANWQGNNLIIKGYDMYNEQRVYVMGGFNSYQQM